MSPHGFARVLHSLLVVGVETHKLAVAVVGVPRCLVPNIGRVVSRGDCFVELAAYIIESSLNGPGKRAVLRQKNHGGTHPGRDFVFDRCN